MTHCCGYSRDRKSSREAMRQKKFRSCSFLRSQFSGPSSFLLAATLMAAASVHFFCDFGCHFECVSFPRSLCLDRVFVKYQFERFFGSAVFLPLSFFLFALGLLQGFRGRNYDSHFACLTQRFTGYDRGYDQGYGLRLGSVMIEALVQDLWNSGSSVTTRKVLFGGFPASIFN